MEAVLGVALLVIGGLAALFFKNKQDRKKQVKQRVDDAARTEEEGEIDATLRFKDRMDKAREAIDKDIADRPRTDDIAADLADRVKRSRRRRRSRRQRSGS